MNTDSRVASRVGKLVWLLGQQKTATAQALAKALGVNVRTVQRYLSALETYGLVERRLRKVAGRGRSFLWVWKGVERDARKR